METEDYENPHPFMRLETPTPSNLAQDNRQIDPISMRALGLPAQRKLFSYAHLAAIITSVLCFMLGTLTITPTLTIAWQLRVNGQIIVIGFLLGIMNLCMQATLPFTFLLLEARFGRSHLQNYEAILSGKFVGSQISLIWRLTFLLLLALPLGLSVAYKRCLGGTASAPYESRQTGSYGLDFPRIGSWSPSNDALYLFQTSFSAFQTASGLGTALYPQEDAFPIAYGYNTLLISNDSAAILDMPTGSYLNSLQSSMYESEKLHINASVNAYIASYNTTTAEIERDDSLWSAIIESGAQNGQSGLSTMELYQPNGARIGVMPFDDNNQTLFALYYNSTEYGGMRFHDFDDEEFNNFRPRAQIYSIKRTRCRGFWSLNSTSILLLGGSCDTGLTIDSNILHKDSMTPFPYDTLPAMAHTYEYYAGRTDSVWLRATYVVSMATMYWARGLFMIQRGLNLPYTPFDEAIVSIRSSLRADWSLYLVLVTQPTITILGFIVAILLHRTPVGKDFGLLSILSGVEPTTLKLIRGAGLSGKSRQPVRIDISTQSTVLDGKETRIQYFLRRDSEDRERSYLTKGSIYS